PRVSMVKLAFRCPRPALRNCGPRSAESGPRMKFGVVILPGSNCDHDALHVVNDILGGEALVLWHKDTDLKGVDCVIIPGGFAYGDYLRAGALATFAPIMEPIKRHAASRGVGSA